MYHLEEGYWWFVGRRLLVRALMKALRLTPPEGSRLLDVGCGTGAMSRELLPLGQVVSLDFCSEALHMTRTRGLEGLCQGSAEALPLRDNSFRAVTALDVVEHLDHDREALAEMFRVTAPGGAAIISVPAFRFLWSEHDVALHHRRRYTARELREVVSGAGYRIVKLSYVMSLLFPAVVLVRLLQHLAPRRKEAKATLPEVGSLGNRLLKAILSLEAAIVCRVNLPLGVSLICVAVKDAA
jgi:2-polyprenyl-3-methyl-5-hydroxy-6-metoxy-1,4-benzoquinol methylase